MSGVIPLRYRREKKSQSQPLYNSVYAVALAFTPRYGLNLTSIFTEFEWTVCDLTNEQLAQLDKHRTVLE